MSHIVNYTRETVQSAILTKSIDIVAYDAWYWDKVAFIPTKKLSPSVKITIGAIAHELFSHGSRLTQLTRVWYPNIADRCGLHPKGAFQDNINFLVKTSALVKDDIEERNPKTNVKMKTHVQIAFTREFIDNPGIFFAEVDSNWGGEGRVPVECPHCHEYHSLKKRSTVTCTGCGSLIEELTTTKTIQNEAPKKKAYTIEQKQHLDTLIVKTAEWVEAHEAYSEVSDIPDIVVAEMGGIEAVEKASPLQIAATMRDVDEMLDMSAEISKEFREKQSKQTVSNDYWTGEA